jgi:hypothetical protein
MQANMSERTVASERRKDARKRPLSLVYVELASANGGMLRDLSEKGFAMRAMMPLRIGETTTFTFSLDGTNRLEGRCKVLWVEEDGRVAGFQFMEVHGDLRAQVRTWLVEKPGYAAPVETPVPRADVSQASTMAELREELRTVGARPEIPQGDEASRTEAGLAGSQSEGTQKHEGKQGEAEDAIVADAAFSRRDHSIHQEPTSEPETVPAQEQVPVLQALPSLDPLPGLDEEGFTSNVGNSNPWLSRPLVWMAMRMILVLALVAGAVVYHRTVGNAIIWLGQKIVGEETPEILPTPKSEINAPVQEAVPNSAVSKAEPGEPTSSDKISGDAAATVEKKPVEVPAVTATTPATARKEPSSTTSAPLPATNKLTTFTPPAVAVTDGGQQEYTSAQNILGNKNAESELPEAVRLLWVAVEKGNSNAEVALAGLYREGRGVAKNCDQAKVLLTAAAKKGNAEAQKRLVQFLAEGCE